MNDHCCRWSGSHPSTTVVLLLGAAMYMMAWEAGMTRVGLPSWWLKGSSEIPSDGVEPQGVMQDSNGQGIIVEWWGLRPLLTPLPNPHQGKVQRVKIDCEADLPSGQSPPCLYTDLCFSQTVIPKGDRKPVCVREWMRAGRDRASKCQMDAKIIWIRPKDRAAETSTTSKVTMSKRTRSIRKTKIEQKSMYPSAFEGGKGTV